MSDLVKNRELIRIEVRWPVTIITEKGPVEGQAKNITVRGVFIAFIHAKEELALNATYRLLINPPGEKIELMGELIWSHITTLPEMGFCFVEVSEGDRERLREAIQKYAIK